MTVDVSGCRNVLEFNDRASSIKTDGCLRAWEHISCSGKYIELSAPGADHLPHRNFNDMITSVSDCSYGGNGNGAVAVAGGKIKIDFSRYPRFSNFLPLNCISVDKVIINMDTSRAPELNDFGRKVKKVMEDWFPFVQTLMTTSAYNPVTKIDVVFDPNYDGVAYAAGTTIVGAVKYFKDHQDDFGAFIHEMTHAVHQARGCPSWVVEGFAEWTRRWFYEPWTANRNREQLKVIDRATQMQHGFWYTLLQRSLINQ